MSIFQGLSVYVLPNGMGKNRAELFKNSLVKNNAKLIDENVELEFDFEETSLQYPKYLIIYDENTIKTWENLDKSLGKKKFFLSIKKELEKSECDPKENYTKLRLKALGSLWLSECLKTKKFVHTENYEMWPLFVNNTFISNECKKITFQKSISTTKDSQNSEDFFKNDSFDNEKEPNSFRRGIKKAGSPKISEDSDDETNKKLKTCVKEPYLEKEISSGSSDDGDNEDISIYYKNMLQSNQIDEKDKKAFKVNTNSWTCAHSSKEQRINHNKKLTDKLESLMLIYENTKDKFRALGYQKAIQALKRCDHPITSFEEAIKLPGIGQKLAEKIAEIAQTGDLRKLDELNSREDLSAIKLFTSVHGIGPTFALSFVNQVFIEVKNFKNSKIKKTKYLGLSDFG